MRFAWMLSALFLAGCGHTAPAPRAYALAHGGGPGDLFLVGGGDESPPLYAEFLKLVGGPDAPIVIVPFAGGPAEAASCQQQFARAGATHVSVLAASDAPTVLSGAAGLYFVGGYSDHLLAAFAPFKTAAQSAWASGCVVGGSSAGAMALGDRTIVDGTSDQALKQGIAGLDVQPGLGLGAGMTIDPHFTQRQRFDRLYVTVRATHTLGIGVDEQTAALVHPGGTLECLGAGSVTLMQPDADGARVELLNPGDSVPLADWRTH
ncbi:MAG TPA: cyanophycinase [Oscillatoriaceae cyanobacterium]